MFEISTSRTFLEENNLYTFTKHDGRFCHHCCLVCLVNPLYDLSFRRNIFSSHKYFLIFALASMLLVIRDPQRHKTFAGLVTILPPQIMMTLIRSIFHKNHLQIGEGEQHYYEKPRVRFLKTKLFLCVPVFTTCDHPMFRGHEW